MAIFLRVAGAPKSIRLSDIFSAAFSYIEARNAALGNPTNRQRDGVVRYQSIRYYGPFPSRLRADRVLQPDFLKLQRLRRILSVLAAGRQRIRSTRKRITRR